MSLEEKYFPELLNIIKRLEEISATMHPYAARHIDEAITELEYYLPFDYKTGTEIDLIPLFEQKDTIFKYKGNQLTVEQKEKVKDLFKNLFTS